MGLGRSLALPGNAVKDFFTRENAWVYVVAEVVRLRAMPETTKFSRIRLPKSLTALRAVSAMTGDTVVWFWIGSHADYDKLLQQL